jgi:tetratricopeptide (TPR) repeat protein
MLELQAMTGLVLSLCVAAGAAAAQPTPEEHAAKLYEQATTHYRQGRFRDAVAEFLEADKLRPSAVLAYDVAQTYEKLGDPGHAGEYYAEYLRRSPNAPDRPVVEASLRNMEAWQVDKVNAGVDPGSGYRQLGWIFLGCGAILAGFGLGALAISQAEPSTNQSAQQAFATTSYVLLGASGLSLGTSGVFFILGSSSFSNRRNAIPPAKGSEVAAGVGLHF